MKPVMQSTFKNKSHIRTVKQTHDGRIKFKQDNVICLSAGESCTAGAITSAGRTLAFGRLT